MTRSYRARLEQFFDELFAGEDLKRCADRLSFCRAVSDFTGEDEKSEQHKLSEIEFNVYSKMVRRLYDAFPVELRPYFKRKGLLGFVEKKGKKTG